MFRLMLRLTFALMLTLAGVLWLTYSAARASGEQAVSELQAFLNPPEGCPRPCWNGIQPGVTDNPTAIRLLKALPWVSDVSLYIGTSKNDIYVNWRWLASAPRFVDTGRLGQIWVHDGEVYAIELPLRIRQGDVQNAFGASDRVTLLNAPLAWPAVFYYTLYFDQTLEFDSTILCPLSPVNVLKARADVHIGVTPSQRALRPGDNRDQVCQG